VRARRFAFSASVVIAGAACASKPKPAATTTGEARPAHVRGGERGDGAPAEAGPTLPAGAIRPAGAIQIDELRGFQATAGAHSDEDDAAWLASHVKPVSVECVDSADTSGVLSLAGDVDGAREGDEPVMVSLTYGVVAVRSRDPLALATTADPIASCDGSQTELIGAWAGQIVDDPEQEIVVIHVEGGRNINVTTLDVYKRRDAQFVSIYTQDLREEDAGDETVRVVELPMLDELVSHDGTTSVRATWDASAFAFRAR
jgi:hypothetical protein